MGHLEDLKNKNPLSKTVFIRCGWVLLRGDWGLVAGGETWWQGGYFGLAICYFI